MTDKIKEIAESHTEDLKFKLLLLTPTDSQHEIIYDEMIKAITEYESSEIARLRGIIERAKLVALKSLHVRGEVIDILSEAEEQ